MVSLFAGGGVLGRPENRLGPFSSNPGTLRLLPFFFFFFPVSFFFFTFVLLYPPIIQSRGVSPPLFISPALSLVLYSLGPPPDSISYVYMRAILHHTRPQRRNYTRHDDDDDDNLSDVAEGNATAIIAAWTNLAFGI